MSRIIVLLLAVVFVCKAATITLPVTQDYTVSNAGHGAAAVQLPNILSFFSNGFQSSVPTFGIDLAPLAVIDRNTISSAQLKFNNFNITRADSATIVVTYLNPGQIFDENTVTLNTQPTSAGILGSVSFSANGAIPIEVKNQLVESLNRGGLFGFRVDLPGGPVTVASHRLDPVSVVLDVTTSDTTSTPTTTTTTTTALPPITSTTTAPTTTGTTPTTTTTAPTTPGTPSTTTTTTTTTTTSAVPTVGPTSSLPGTSSVAPTVPPPPTSTEQVRNTSSGKTQVAVIMCIVPLIVALLL